VVKVLDVWGFRFPQSSVFVTIARYKVYKKRPLVKKCDC